MGKLLEGKRISLDGLVLRDTADCFNGVAIEDNTGRIVGFIYGKNHHLCEPYVSIKSRYTDRVISEKEVVFRLKPEEKKLIRIPDGLLADIFYTLVHDFDSEIIGEARSEIKHHESPRYKKQIEAIRDWARTNDFGTIQDRAESMLEKIGTE